MLGDVQYGYWPAATWTRFGVLTDQFLSLVSLPFQPERSISPASSRLASPAARFTSWNASWCYSAYLQSDCRDSAAHPHLPIRDHRHDRLRTIQGPEPD